MPVLNFCRDAAKSFPICSRFLKSSLAWANCSASRVPRALLTTVSLPTGASRLEGGVAVGGATAVVVVTPVLDERGVATDGVGVAVGGVISVVAANDERGVASNERGVAVVVGGIAAAVEESNEEIDSKREVSLEAETA